MIGPSLRAPCNRSLSRLSSLPTHGTQSPVVRRILPPQCTPACDCWTDAIGASRQNIDGRLSASLALSARDTGWSQGGDVHIPSLTMPSIEPNLFHNAAFRRLDVSFLPYLSLRPAPGDVCLACLLAPLPSALPAVRPQRPLARATLNVRPAIRDTGLKRDLRN